MYCETLLYFYHKMVFLFSFLLVFLLVFFISFSFLLIFIQSLFSFVWYFCFFSFLVSFYKYSEDLVSSAFRVSDKNFLSNVTGCSKFLFFYFIFESYFNFIFLLSYFLGEVFLEVVLLFKQGVFPFIIYNFLVFSFSLKVYFLKMSFLIFLLFSKFWCFLLFSKVVFCLEFYFSYVFLGLLLIFKGFKKWLSFFMSKGVVLNNLLFFLLCEVFSFEVIMVYSGALVYYYKDLISLNWKSLGSKVSSLFLVFNFIHGGFFNFFIFIKVVCLLSFFYYGGCGVVFCFLLVSFLYLYYSLMGLVFLMKVKIKLEIKFVMGFLSLLGGSSVLSMVYGVCDGFIYWI